MGEKKDLDAYFAACRELSRKQRAKKEAKRLMKEALKGLSRKERLIIKGKGILHTLDTVSKRAAKFDIDELHEQEKYLAGKKKKTKDPDKVARDFLKGYL